MQRNAADTTATVTTMVYRCIRCMSALRDINSAELCCRGCGRNFPVINGIPILTSRPRELLMVHLQEFRQAQTAAVKKRDLLPGLIKNRATPGTAESAERMLHGMSRNLALIDRFMKPIEEYLNKTTHYDSTLIDWALAQHIGSVPQINLPFFYQDWRRTKDYQEAESLIVDALVEHRVDNAAVAILGAGACGIAHASAKHFCAVYGLDLSVPTLLIAQAVLAGTPIEVHLPLAGWRCAEIPPPPPAQNDIRLVAANVGILPFGEATLSGVVTQYLMDVVGDPLGVAAEIQRVLKPGGVWVNFSNPFRLAGDPLELPLPEPGDLPGLFQPFGLEMIKVERKRFTLVNLDQVHAGGHRNVQEVHFFAARKAERPTAFVARKRFQIWDKHEEEDSWWQHVPKIIPGREIQISRKRTFGPGGTQDSIELGLNAVSFSVSDDHLAFIEALFGSIDGKHTLREILTKLVSKGIPISETEFRELIYCLLNEYCLINLDI